VDRASADMEEGTIFRDIVQTSLWSAPYDVTTTNYFGDLVTTTNYVCDIILVTFLGDVMMITSLK